MADNEGFAAGIWYRGELVGLVDLFNINWARRVAEIGYWLGKEFQGKGLATTACRALAQHAFGNLGLDSIQAKVAPGNARSDAVVGRLLTMTNGRITLVSSDLSGAPPLRSVPTPTPGGRGDAQADNIPLECRPSRLDP